MTNKIFKILLLNLIILSTAFIGKSQITTGELSGRVNTITSAVPF